MVEFNEKLPKWEAEGVEPPKTKQEEGWSIGDRPPAEWFNWLQNRTYKSLEELQKVAIQLGIDIENIDVTEELDDLAEELRKEIAQRVIKEEGKGLSTNDYTNQDKALVGTIKDRATKEDLNKHTESLIFNNEVHGLTVEDGKLKYTDGYDWHIVDVDSLKVRDDGTKALKVQVSKTIPVAEDGRIYYNSTQKLFYVARDGQWYRLFVSGDAKLEQEAPTTAPKLASKTDTTVELEFNEEMEFRYQGSSWQEDNVFKGLQRNETYKFEQRYKEDDIYKASPPSPALSVTTDKGTQTAPNPPTVIDIDFDRATVTGSTNTEVSVDKQNWYSSPHTFTGLTEETEYTAYARKKETNTHKPSLASSGTQFTTLSESRIYGVTIESTNANPSTRVKYIDDALGFSPVRGNDGSTNWGSWKDTFIYEKFKPCLVKNGEVQYYLNKEDFTKKEGGGTANLTGVDGDVMVEISKMWYKIETIGDKIYVRVSDAYQDGFKCLAHTRGNSEVDKIYVGAYLGYEQSGKLRSISGVEPTGNKTIGNFRTLAEANGDRYHQVPFTVLTLLQSIMVILLKSTDTQTALGRGFVDGSSSSSFLKTGGTNSKGMMYGSTSGTGISSQMCFMGIEDFWGNKRWWIDGLKYDGGSIKLGTTDFNNDANGYKTVGSYSTLSYGYIKSVKGTSEEGYIPTSTDGSSSTYYCDRGHVYDGGFPSFGGHRSYDSNAGGFYLNSYSASNSYSILGSRLFVYGK